MDDGSPIGYLLVIVLFILGGAYFAGTEIAFASVSRIRMMSNAANGDKRAKRVLYILDHFDKALTTLLIGNNIMHIGCASIATLLATKLWGTGAVAAVTFVTTAVVFLLAEMLPKRFAKAASEPFAMTASGSLLFLMRVLSPVAFVFSKLSGLISRPFQKKRQEAPTVTEDELFDILETISREGAIDEEKSELVQSALEFSRIRVRDVLTPWADVLKITTAMRDDEILAVIRNNAHSRLPVVDRAGTVIGLLHIRKYLKAYLKREERVRLRNVMDTPFFASPETEIDDLLPVMSAHRTQTAIVRDDTTKAPLGLITVEDILEELVGEIYDEEDRDGREAER